MDPGPPDAAGGGGFDYATSGHPEQVYGPSNVAVNLQPTQIVFPAGESVWGFKDITPRMGATFDLFGTGKTALKFNLGKYSRGDRTQRHLGAEQPDGDGAHQPVHAQLDRQQRQLGRGLRPRRTGRCKARSAPSPSARRPARSRPGMPRSISVRHRPGASPSSAAGSTPRRRTPASWAAGGHVPTTGRSASPCSTRSSRGCRPKSGIAGAGWAISASRTTSAPAPGAVTGQRDCLTPRALHAYSIVAPLDATLCPGGGGYLVEGLYDINDAARRHAELRQSGRRGAPGHSRSTRGRLQLHGAGEQRPAVPRRLGELPHGRRHLPPRSWTTPKGCAAVTSSGRGFIGERLGVIHHPGLVRLAQEINVSGRVQQHSRGDRGRELPGRQHRHP